MKGPARPVGVQRDRQPVGDEHRPQGRHDGGRGLAGPELGVEQPLGGVVEHGEQGLRLLGTAAQPGVRAAVEMEHLAHTRPRLAAAAMPAARPALADQPGLLEHEPDETVRQRDAMVAPGEAVEVADVPPAIAVLIEPQEALHLGHRSLPA